MKGLKLFVTIGVLALVLGAIGLAGESGSKNDIRAGPAPTSQMAFPDDGVTGAVNKALGLDTVSNGGAVSAADPNSVPNRNLAQAVAPPSPALAAPLAVPVWPTASQLDRLPCL